MIILKFPRCHEKDILLNIVCIQKQLYTLNVCKSNANYISYLKDFFRVNTQ